MDKMKMETPDLAQGNVEKLAALFPACVTEARDGRGQLKKAVNFELLRQLLSGDAVEGEEAYEFTWVGKKAAVAEANRPIRMTLRPCPGESVDWDSTGNLYIKGDNLDVLKLLRESYLGGVKMIYIDPPYNTGKNYIYRNNFSMDGGEYAEQAGIVNEAGAKLVADAELVPNPAGSARFHSAWLSMMYQRLLIAKDLLSRDGVLVCAIDENEFANLAAVMREIFGESSYEHAYVSVVHNPRGQQGNNFSYVNEYLIFVYPADGRKYLADFPKNETDARNLRDSGTESDRSDARMCFYPFYVKDMKIVGIGEVPDSGYHPERANVTRPDGTMEIWPMTDEGDEKKWRYARQSVEAILGKLEPKMGRNSVQIIYNKDEGTMRSVWANARYDSSEYGTKLLDKLLGGCAFTFPKSLYAVYDCVKAATFNDKDAVVMDFFSGSATTAHAVMQLNADDGGNRRFIMVQLPEDLDKAAARGGTDAKTRASIKEAIQLLDEIGAEHTICGIGEERIRRAAAKIAEENPGAAFDGGFRVFALDDSNMTDVYYSAGEYSQDMLAALEENIKPDRTDLDLLFGCLLEWGLPLTMPCASEQIDGCTVHTCGGDLIACFDEKVPDSVVREIAGRRPRRAVFRDSAFADSPAKINAGEIFKMLAPDTSVKVL